MKSKIADISEANYKELLKSNNQASEQNIRGTRNRNEIHRNLTDDKLVFYINGDRQTFKEKALG